ncbi:alpha/beta hydrolase [Duganella sp. LX20W]|uniref:Alpha/beta hydrolase n=1 Tax=Rugamonas brunnea TaxID=2758569 RepID=A0A7W2IDL8_9BURK|nr:gamma-mobile-trio protein GmtX [Rugamonas brunnea]MBA5639478.1 alpha/beta hydrolase [Rugamonas brunnea]
MSALNNHPDEVLKRLLDKSLRADKAEKLRRLHSLCEKEFERHSSGARDFSLANMSKVAESAGLFRARTIYNAQSVDYANLVKAWEAHNGTTNTRKNNKVVEPLKDKYDFLAKIEDQALRSLCRIAFSERDKLKAELNLLKSQTVVTVDMRPIGMHTRTSYVTADSNVKAIELSDSEHKALSAAIDPATLARKGWSIGEAGEIIDERRRFVFNPGFATGLAKLLSKIL